MTGFTRTLLVIALSGVHAAFALDPERGITELAHRSWGAKEGAPTFALAIAQTTDGYLWIGGYGGLYRFDGTRFQPFEAFSGPKLPSREIFSLFASPEGKLWIGYRNGGVSVLEAGKLTNYNSANGFPEGKVFGFAQDRDGRVWVASSGGLASFEGDRWRVVGNASNFPGSGAQAVLVDHLGAVWVAGEHRVAVLSPGSSKFELTEEPHGAVGQLAESPDGTVWMAETTRSVRPITRPAHGMPYRGMSGLECQTRFPDTWKTESRCQRPDNLEVYVGSRATLFDRNGSFWIATVGDGLRRAPYPSHLKREPIGEFSSALEQFTSKDGLSADYVTSIFEDREGNIWATTRDGVDQFRDSDLAPVVFGPDSAIFFLVPGDNGYVFALDSTGRIFRFHDADVTAIFDEPGLAARLGQGMLLYRDPLGSIWVQGAESACRLIGHQCIDRVERPQEKSRTLGQWRFAIDGSRQLWAYVEYDGLFVRENGHWTAVTGAPSGLAPDTQFTDASGQIWFGFSNGHLVSVKDGHSRTYSSDDGLTVGAIKAIDSLGAHVWVGGDRGLALLSGSRFTSVLPYDVPAFDSVSGVVEGADGSLWLNEHRGVVRISPTEVEGVLQNGTHRTNYEVLDSLDGLPGVTAGVSRFPTAIRGTDGRLWFVAARGVAWVKPGHPYRNTLPPPVLIQSIVADDKAFAPSAKLELPGTTSNLQIAYTALSLAVPERVQFKYRLEGLDRDWQKAGTRRTAYYTRLPPGSYAFQVIASNDAGVWNNVGARLPIRILPAWYQTWWFYALSAALVVTALAALYRWRLGRVRAETHRLLEARLSERERIARDLHDTLLQGFQGLMFRLQAVRELLPLRPGDAEKFLDSAMEAGDQAIGEGRDAVQNLRSPSVDEGDLATSLGALGTELGVGIPFESRPQYRVVVEGRPRDLAVDIRDDAYRTVREAVRNAYQHAKARHIETELSFGDSDLYIRVRDDGIGVDPQVLAQGKRTGHWGLPGMRERSESFGGRLRVWSERDAGTEVELRIPAQVAYKQRPPSTSSRLRGLISSVLERRTADRGGGLFITRYAFRKRRV